MRRVQKECDLYGLCIVQCLLSYRWAVFRPLTPDTITFVDIRDITYEEIEHVVMSWALSDLFNNPSP